MVTGPPPLPQIATSLRKKVDDATLTFSFTDVSLKEPRLGKGVVLAVEKPLAGEVLQGWCGQRAHEGFPASLTRRVTSPRLTPPPTDGVKGSLAYDVGARNPIAAVTVNRTINGSDVQLRGIYRRNGDVFILEEQWKVDKNTRVNGRCEQWLKVWVAGWWIEAPFCVGFCCCLGQG